MRKISVSGRPIAIKSDDGDAGIPEDGDGIIAQAGGGSSIISREMDF